MPLKVIHKKILPRRHAFVLDLPRNAKLLSVQTPHNEPVLWYLFDPNHNATDERTFRILTTGCRVDLEKSAIYIGTFLLFGGEFVGHLFEVPND